MLTYHCWLIAADFFQLTILIWALHCACTNCTCGYISSNVTVMICAITVTDSIMWAWLVTNIFAFSWLGSPVWHCTLLCVMLTIIFDFAPVVWWDWLLHLTGVLFIIHLNTIVVHCFTCQLTLFINWVTNGCWLTNHHWVYHCGAWVVVDCVNHLGLDRKMVLTDDVGWLLMITDQLGCWHVLTLHTPLTTTPIGLHMSHCSLTCWS